MKRFNRVVKRRLAFTLIELLTAIGIIGLVLTLSIVAFAPALKATETATAARSLRAVLDTARLRAIGQHRVVRVDGSRLTVSYDSWAVGIEGESELRLPDFVGVRISCNSPETFYTDRIERWSLTFDSKGAVASFRVDTALVAQPTAPIAFCVITAREATEAECIATARYLRVYPLIGTVASHDASDLPSDLPVLKGTE